MTTRRTYSTEFKREAVALVQTSGKSLAEVERELGLTHGLLKHWMRDAKRAGAASLAGRSVEVVLCILAITTIITPGHF